VSRADGRILLRAYAAREGVTPPITWKRLTDFCQDHFRYAESTAYNVASGRLGVRRAAELRKLLEWEGRQLDLPIQPREVEPLELTP
jgi:hypothetical protein